MRSIDFLLTFRGIDVPTTKMIGKDACGLTFRRFVDGREQDSDQIVFAYEEGIVWKTTLVDVQPGNTASRCSAMISIVHKTSRLTRASYLTVCCASNSIAKTVGGNYFRSP